MTGDQYHRFAAYQESPGNDGQGDRSLKVTNNYRDIFVRRPSSDGTFIYLPTWRFSPGGEAVMSVAFSDKDKI